jgi:outer membrane protein insertion porin family
MSFIQFFKARHKKDEHPDVIGFRLLAGTAGSFATTAKVKETNSLAFIDGVPIYERFFLGDEFTIRGYNVRSITPVAPLDTFISSRNVVVASNSIGTPVAVPGFNQSLANIGTFTGPTGNNVVKLPRAFTGTGGDTQVLGNLEYRIPLFGPITAALFADAGSAFNLRTKGIQSYHSEFLADQPYLGSIGAIPCPRLAPAGTSASDASLFRAPVSLSTLAACNTFTNLALTATGALVARDNRLISQSEFAQALRLGPTDPNTGLPFGLQQVFLRGDAQTTTVVNLSQSLFAKITDVRTSLGAELRFEIPIMHVPFRLIYAYNPNARHDTVIEGFPLFFNEKKNVFRFSVGRTF